MQSKLPQWLKALAVCTALASMCSFAAYADDAASAPITLPPVVAAAPAPAAPTPTATAPAFPVPAPAQAPLLELPKTGTAPVTPPTPGTLPTPVTPPVPPLPKVEATPAAPAAQTAAVPSPTTPILPATSVTPATAPSPVVALPASTQSVTDQTPQNPGGSPPLPNVVVPKDEDIFMPKVITVNNLNNTFQLLEEPIAIPGDFSLMFTHKEMVSIVEPSLVLYDKSAEANSSNSSAGSNGDDLTGLLESLKIKGDSKQSIKPPSPPNLYLGSIVYYSPGNWSVWVNGKKIVPRTNSENNVLYVSKIDRSEVQLVWRTPLFNEIVKAWNNESAHSQFVSVDEKRGTVTMTLHPNQTFVPADMTVNEGLIIKTETATQTTTPDAAPLGYNPNSDAAALGKAIHNHN